MFVLPLFVALHVHAKPPTVQDGLTCGAVYKEPLLGRLNPMKAMQRAAGGALTKKTPDLGVASVTVLHLGNLFPQHVMRYPTKTPGWRTCGSAVSVQLTPRTGAGLLRTDGGVRMVNGDTVEYAGMGNYFRAVDSTGPVEVEITSSDGDVVSVPVQPAAPLGIRSIDGVPPGEPVTIDGSKDIVIELENGSADPYARLHVQMVTRMVGTPIMSDLLVTVPKDRIVIPKEAFYNFETSPSPFVEDNVLIVNRVRETFHPDTDAGAVHSLGMYHAFAPVTVAGDLVNGTLLTNGFVDRKNTHVDIAHQGERYAWTLGKGNPFSSPPLAVMERVAVASVVVRGTLSTTERAAAGGWLVETTKYFPEVSEAAWQGLADRLYDDVTRALTDEFGVEVVPVEQVVASEAYRRMHPVPDPVTKTEVEVGARGTRRLLTSTPGDLLEDLGITFPGDTVSEALVSELGVNAVLAMTVDLEMDFDSGALHPKVSLQLFAPNASYKTAATYVRGTATADARSLAEAAAIEGGATEQLYGMIHGPGWAEDLRAALEKMARAEAEEPVYERLWRAKI